MDGFETAAWVTKNHPDIKIMALSMQGDDNSVIKMIKNGAKGYLLKIPIQKIWKQPLRDSIQMVSFILSGLQRLYSPISIKRILKQQ